MEVLSVTAARPRTFRDVVVHPTQELPHPAAYRGGPDWPQFEAQILARHCWGAFPRPIDWRPHPAEPEWPYFDRARYLNPQFSVRRRWRALLPDTRPRQPDRNLAALDSGIWCGAVYEHFGVMIANYGMRLLASSRLDAMTPLVFSIFPIHDYEPEPFFWAMLDHFGIDRDRVMLIRKPVRFARLTVVPQAERPDGGAPSRRHLAAMDALTAAFPAAEPDHPAVFVSRSLLGRGNFAGEPYLDEVMAAAGIHVFHPQNFDLHTQLSHYRRAPRLIFSEGSALHGLQLLGHIGADLTVLTRRPGSRLAAASLRPRVRALRYLDVVRGVVQGLNHAGEAQPAKGISVLDERALIEGLRSVGIDLAPFWDPLVFAERRDADIDAWIAERSALAIHPDDGAAIESSLCALSLRHLHA